MHRHSRLPPFTNGHRPRGCLTRTLSSMSLSDLNLRPPGYIFLQNKQLGFVLFKGGNKQLAPNIFLFQHSFLETSADSVSLVQRLVFSYEEALQLILFISFQGMCFNIEIIYNIAHPTSKIPTRINCNLKRKDRDS